MPKVINHMVIKKLNRTEDIVDVVLEKSGLNSDTLSNYLTMDLNKLKHKLAHHEPIEKAIETKLVDLYVFFSLYHDKHKTTFDGDVLQGLQ